MNEKRMGTVILILLIVLNLVLFAYYSYQKFTENWVTMERMDSIKELYRQNGIEIKAEPERKNEQRPILELGEANLDQMVESILNDDFEKSFIYGSKIQYTAGSLEILTDRNNHSISYVDKAKQTPEILREGGNLEEWARTQRITEEDAEQLMEKKAYEFARKWLGDDIRLIKTNEKTYGCEYTFHPMREEMVLYFNELTVWMVAGNVASAELSYWSVTDETEDSHVLMPIDEILYALLDSIRDEMEADQKDEVVQIMDGYQLVRSGEQTKAVPAITIVMGSGKEYVMNRTAV